MEIDEALSDSDAGNLSPAGPWSPSVSQPIGVPSWASRNRPPAPLNTTQRLMELHSHEEYAGSPEEREFALDAFGTMLGRIDAHRLRQVSPSQLHAATCAAHAWH